MNICGVRDYCISKAFLTAILVIFVQYLSSLKFNAKLRLGLTDGWHDVPLMLIEAWLKIDNLSEIVDANELPLTRAK